MLIRAMVREKLGSPRSSPKRKRPEPNSPDKFETPKKRVFSPFRLLQSKDVDIGNLQTPQSDQAGGEFFKIKPKILCTDVKVKNDSLNPLLRNTIKVTDFGGTSKKSEALRSRLKGTLSMVSFDIK